MSKMCCFGKLVKRNERLQSRNHFVANILIHVSVHPTMCSKQYKPLIDSFSLCLNRKEDAPIEKK